MCKVKILDREFVSEFIKPRAKDCNKGSFGSVLIVGSSDNFSGTVTICTLSSLRTGAGLTFAASTKTALISARVNAPEAIFIPLTETNGGQISFENADLIIEKANSCSALVLGCGLSICEDTKKLVEKVLKGVRVPTVLDADGINIVSENIDILRNTSCPIVLTPHLKEMSRLIHKDVSYIKQNKAAVASEFSKEFSVTVVLKDFETVIANGDELYKNCGGHACMAKGGSGDMLAGMLGALLSQGLSPINSAACAVYLHSKAGEICGERMGDYSVIARDMIFSLPEVFKEFC